MGHLHSTTWYSWLQLSSSKCFASSKISVTSWICSGKCFSSLSALEQLTSLPPISGDSSLRKPVLHWSISLLWTFFLSMRCHGCYAGQSFNSTMTTPFVNQLFLYSHECHTILHLFSISRHLWYFKWHSLDSKLSL